MAKKSQAVRQDGRAPMPGWVWLVTGFTLGVLLSALLIFRDLKQEKSKLPEPKPGGATSADISQETNKPAAERPKYEFYNVLPEREIAIPDDELKARNAAPAPAPEPANVRYFLQIGSFAGEAEAEGIDVKGKIWFRLRTGPYANAQTLESAKVSMEANGVKAIAVREAAP
jgi:cell division protein FtsN